MNILAQRSTSHPIVKIVETLRDSTPRFRGKVRLMNGLLKRLNRQRVRFGGLSIELDFSEEFERMAMMGLCETRVVETLKRELAPGEVFCDVGAHVGILSILMADYLGQGGQVYAFEAAPPTFERLSGNFNALRSAPCALEAVQAAVGSETGSVEMHVSERLVHSSLSTEFRDLTVSMGERSQSVQVPATTLDDFFYSTAQRRIPHALKIDVEGWEPHVIRGASRLLREGRPRAVILERLHNPLYSEHIDVSGVDHLMAEAGYSLAEDLGEDVLFCPLTDK